MTFRASSQVVRKSRSCFQLTIVSSRFFNKTFLALAKLLLACSQDHHEVFSMCEFLINANYFEMVCNLVGGHGNEILTTFSGNLWPGRYFTFSCVVLIISVSFLPSIISSNTYIVTRSASSKFNCFQLIKTRVNLTFILWQSLCIDTDDLGNGRAPEIISQTFYNPRWITLDLLKIEIASGNERIKIAAKKIDCIIFNAPELHFLSPDFHFACKRFLSLHWWPWKFVDNDHW